jgi:hypothetical protein
LEFTANKPLAEMGYEIERLEGMGLSEKRTACSVPEGEFDQMLAAVFALCAEPFRQFLHGVLSKY